MPKVLWLQEIPCCVVYALRCQVHWTLDVDDTRFASILIWYSTPTPHICTHTHTTHTGINRTLHTYINTTWCSAANKYYSTASHHEQKNKKTTGQIKLSAVTKQRIRLVLQHAQCQNEFNVLVQVLPLHGLSTIFPV